MTRWWLVPAAAVAAPLALLVTCIPAALCYWLLIGH